MTHQLDRVRRTEAGLQDLLYAPAPAEDAPELRLCAPAAEQGSTPPPIRHLASSLVKCLDDSHSVASTTYADGLLEQLTTHVDQHPEDTRATLDALLCAFAEAAGEVHSRKASRVSWAAAPASAV